VTRIEQLSPGDYGVLATLHEGCVPDPKTSIVGVAKDGEEIVGRVFLLCPAHVEGPWVREDRRGGFVGKRLMDWAEAEAKSAGCQHLFAYGDSDDLEGYLQRLGYEKQKLTVWKKVL